MDFSWSGAGESTVFYPGVTDGDYTVLNRGFWIVFSFFCGASIGMAFLKRTLLIELNYLSIY